MNQSKSSRSAVAQVEKVMNPSQSWDLQAATHPQRRPPPGRLSCICQSGAGDAQKRCSPSSAAHLAALCLRLLCLGVPAPLALQAGNKVRLVSPAVKQIAGKAGRVWMEWRLITTSCKGAAGGRVSQFVSLQGLPCQRWQITSGQFCTTAQLDTCASSNRSLAPQIEACQHPAVQAASLQQRCCMPHNFI